MATSSDRQHLIPSFLYSTSFTSKALAPDKMTLNPDPSSTFSAASKSFVIPSPSESCKIEMFSPQYYAACTVGGILSCGLSHTAFTPLELVKRTMKRNPAEFKGIKAGVGLLLIEQGFKGLCRGWVPTLLGHSAHGAFKFGFYEFYKKHYTDSAAEKASKSKTQIYLAASGAAELTAITALCPFEEVKVRVQTQPGFARGLADGLPKIVRSEGARGLFKGLVSLRCRQVPYTMMEFTSFEIIVENIYKRAIIMPKNECSKSQQLGVSFAGGFFAGVFCGIASLPVHFLSFLIKSTEELSLDLAVEKHGTWAVYSRGLLLRFVMIGTLTGAQWGIYDAFKVFVGLPTTGGIAPAAAPVKHELYKVSSS